MKYIFFLLMTLLPLTKASAVETPYLISGFDDVLRQAENTGLLKSALKILEADKTFAGMPELYRQITAKETSPQFALVSAISTWFDGRIETFLEQNEMPTHTQYLRNWLTEWSIEDFKLNRIRLIMAAHPNRKFIVIFDHSEASLKLSKELYQLYPSLIQAIYLHKIVENQVPQGESTYYTAFDIAVAEYTQNRLTLDALKKVGASVINETRKYLLFPPYAICPKDYIPCSKESSDTKEICQLVGDHVRHLCLR
jgi:phosphatidate phosphatase APP1